MEIETLALDFSVCQLEANAAIDWNRQFCFLEKTDEELSLVCPTADVPAAVLQREDGWKGFRVSGTLDFSLIGILADLAATLAACQISIYAISTYRTDYIFVKQKQFDAALQALRNAGYQLRTAEEK